MSGPYLIGLALLHIVLAISAAVVPSMADHRAVFLVYGADCAHSARAPVAFATEVFASTCPAALRQVGLASGQPTFLIAFVGVWACQQAFSYNLWSAGLPCRPHFVVRIGAVVN